MNQAVSIATTKASVIRDPGFSKKRRAMFLRILSETGRVNFAAQACGYASPDALYAYRRANPDFAKEWAEAMERAGDSLEDEAFRRAREGIEKDVYYQGNVVGQERVYSDGLMAKLLDGAKPDKYKLKSDSARSNLNINIGLAVVPQTAPQLEEWERTAIAQEEQNVLDAQFEEVPQKKLEPPAAAPKVVRA